MIRRDSGDFPGFCLPWVPSLAGLRRGYSYDVGMSIIKYIQIKNSFHTFSPGILIGSSKVKGGKDFASCYSQFLNKKTPLPTRVRKEKGGAQRAQKNWRRARILLAGTEGAFPGRSRKRKEICCSLPR